MRQCYVGQTTRAIKIRLNEHRSSMRVYQSKSIKEREEQQKSERRFGETTAARHFVEVNHRINELRWLVLEKIHDNDPQQIGSKLLRRDTGSNRIE